MTRAVTREVDTAVVAGIEIPSGSTYLAGPMRGYHLHNFPAFRTTAQLLRERGYIVVSPAELDGPANVEFTAVEDLDPQQIQEFLSRDLTIVASPQISEILLMPGWANSKGARLEAQVGLATGKRFGLAGLSGDGTYLHVDFMTHKEVQDCLDLRTPQPAEEERIVIDPQTGGRKGQKLAQLGAIDPSALLELAKVAGFGGQKYERLNYMRGYDWSLSFDAGMRHRLRFWSGIDLDEDSGLPHLAHAAWHDLTLLAFWLHDLGSDDRYRSAR